MNDYYNKSQVKINQYIQKDILNYSRLRNFDFGPEKRGNVSNLSKFISHRIINEFNFIKQILVKHKIRNVEKFIQEIFWRVYWKGWLENRPKVWQDFIDSISKIDITEDYINACNGKTDVNCFNHWVKELKNYNYLHNHTRMWFASIWIFTLKLPWQLGARFFLENLYDGDAASNTLSWRWVAGLQTKNKHYLAKSWNIEKFTSNRYMNINLNESAGPIEEIQTYPVEEKIFKSDFKKKNNTLLLFENDLCFFNRKEIYESYAKIYILLIDNNLRKISINKNVFEFKLKLILNFKDYFNNCEVVVIQSDLKNFPTCKDLDIIYPSVGENLDFLIEMRDKLKLNLNFFFRKEDTYCWRFAKKGFFNFKNNIPKIIENLELSENFN